MREVAWVVFDEIHYMRDKGRSQGLILSKRNYASIAKSHDDTYQIK